VIRLREICAVFEKGMMLVTKNRQVDWNGNEHSRT
jgi:hypothetical protein